MALPKLGFPMSLNLSLLVSLALFIALLLINQPLETTAAPKGIVSLQMAGSAERSLEIVASWGSEAIGYARLSLWLDFLFAVAYVSTLLLLTRHLSRDRPGVREQTFSRSATLLFLSAGMADIAENAIMLNNLHSPSDVLSMAVTVLALAKFTGLILGLAGLVVLRAARRHPLSPTHH